MKATLQPVPVLCLVACLTCFAAVSIASAQYPPPPGTYPPPPGYYPPPHAVPPRPDPAYCDIYARDQAMRYAPPGAALSGAARGAARGAVFGAIVGGKKGAQRGAAIGGGLGLIGAGARADAERGHAYRLAYDDCIRGFPR